MVAFLVIGIGVAVRFDEMEEVTGNIDVDSEYDCEEVNDSAEDMMEVVEN